MSRDFVMHRPKGAAPAPKPSPQQGPEQGPEQGPKPAPEPAAKTASAAPAVRRDFAAPGKAAEPPKEVGGPKGPEPTRYGDWERKGICYDF